MVPPPARRNAGTACLQSSQVPVRLTSSTRRQTSSGVSSTEPTAWIPAPATATSSLPQRSSASATAAASAAESVTSATTALRLLPASPSESRTAPTHSSQRSAPTTVAPLRAKAAQVARPIPPPAPVTSTPAPRSQGRSDIGVLRPPQTGTPGDQGERGVLGVEELGRDGDPGELVAVELVVHAADALVEVPEPVLVADLVVDSELAQEWVDHADAVDERPLLDEVPARGPREDVEDPQAGIADLLVPERPRLADGDLPGLGVPLVAHPHAALDDARHVVVGLGHQRADVDTAQLLDRGALGVDLEDEGHRVGETVAGFRPRVHLLAEEGVADDHRVAVVEDVRPEVHHPQPAVEVDVEGEQLGRGHQRAEVGGAVVEAVDAPHQPGGRLLVEVALGVAILRAQQVPVGAVAVGERLPELHRGVQLGDVLGRLLLPKDQEHAPAEERADPQAPDVEHVDLRSRDATAAPELDHALETAHTVLHVEHELGPAQPGVGEGQQLVLLARDQARHPFGGAQHQLVPEVPGEVLHDVVELVDRVV